MTRNLKALGLALVAAFALSAMTASGASAAPALFTTNNHVGKAKAHGGQVGNHTFTIGALPAVTCATVTYTGEAITAGTESTYGKGARFYDTCHIVIPLLGTRAVTITTNNCTNTITVTKNTTSGGTQTSGVNTPFSADFTLECPVGKQIEIHVYNTANHNDAGAAVLCTYDVVTPQTISNQIQLTNTASHEILAHIHMTVALTNTKLGGICGNSANPTAVYKGQETGAATNSVGESVGSTVS